MIGILMVLVWVFIGTIVYYSLPHLPLGAMGVVNQPILRWQYTLFSMGWTGKLIAFAAYFPAGKYWAIGIAIAALMMLFATIALVAWNWNPKTKSEIIDDLRKQLYELEKN